MKESKNLNQIHSPFLFDFLVAFLNFEYPKEDNELIKKFRIQLANDTNTFNKDELNPDLQLKRGHSFKQKINVEYRNASISIKKAKLIYFLCSYFKPENILELGSNLGLSAFYMALASKKSLKNLISLEGCSELNQLAKSNNNKFLKPEINETLIFKKGLFAETIPNVWEHFSKVDLVYNDGDHRGHSMIEYFSMIKDHLKSNSIFIFDDIYWSKSTLEAWENLCNLPEVTLSLNVYHTGVLFFNKDLTKEKILFRI